MTRFLESFFGPLYPVFQKMFGFLFGSGGFETFLLWLKAIAGVLSLVLFFAVFYNISQTLKLRRKHLREMLKYVLEHESEHRISRWEKIKGYLESENVSDWKQAILDADNLVEDIFERVGYSGANLGQMILKIKPYQLESLPDLFRAHRVKNRIIKNAGGFEITKEKAEETIGLYEKVLTELEYV